MSSDSLAALFIFSIRREVRVGGEEDLPVGVHDRHFTGFLVADASYSKSSWTMDISLKCPNALMSKLNMQKLLNRTLNKIRSRYRVSQKNCA